MSADILWKAIFTCVVLCVIWFVICTVYVLIGYIFEWTTEKCKQLFLVVCTCDVTNLVSEIETVGEYIIAKIKLLFTTAFVFIKEKLERLRKPSKTGRELIYQAVVQGASWDNCTRAAFEWTKDKAGWSNITCDFAAIYGYLDILQAARSNGCTWSADTCALAAKYGHLKLLKWAHYNGCEWDSKVCSNAAASGHLEVLMWARKKKCDWDFRTCANAVINNHRKVLLWAKENGCECDQITMSMAKEKWPGDFF